MEAVVIIAFLGGLFSLIWAFVGLLAPKALFFAHPDRKTRSAAFAFPLTCLTTFIFLLPAAGGLGWGFGLVTMVTAGLSFRYARKLSQAMPEAEPEPEAELPAIMIKSDDDLNHSNIDDIGLGYSVKNQKQEIKHCLQKLAVDYDLKGYTVKGLMERVPDFLYDFDPTAEAIQALSMGTVDDMVCLLIVTSRRLLFIDRRAAKAQRALPIRKLAFEIPSSSLVNGHHSEGGFLSPNIISIYAIKYADNQRQSVIFSFNTKIKKHSKHISDVIGDISNPPDDWVDIPHAEDYEPWSQNGLKAYDFDYEKDEDREDADPVLSRSEWFQEWKDRLEYFLGHRPSKQEEIKYRKLFGGDNECRFNLAMFAARVKDGRACIHAEADDYYRPRYEVLAATGVMLTGKGIAPHDRLLALSMAQLRILAQALGLPKQRAKADLLKQLQQCEAGAIEKKWPLTEIDVNDLFLADSAPLQ